MLQDVTKFLSDSLQFIFFISIGGFLEMNGEEIRSIVKKARKKQGYSRRLLAELTGTTEITIARFEGGKTCCSIDLVLRIFDELGVEFNVTC